MEACGVIGSTRELSGVGAPFVRGASCAASLVPLGAGTLTGAALTPFVGEGAALGGASLVRLAELGEGRGTAARLELGGASLVRFVEAGPSVVEGACAALPVSEPFVEDGPCPEEVPFADDGPCPEEGPLADDGPFAAELGAALLGKLCVGATLPLDWTARACTAVGSGSSTIANEGIAETLTTCLVKPGVGVSPKLAIEARAESGPVSDRTPKRSGSVPLRRRALSGGVASAAPFDFATAPFGGVVAPFDFATAPFDFAAKPAGFAPIAQVGRRLRASASARSTSKPSGGLTELGVVPCEESALPISEDFSLGLDIEMVEESTTTHADRQREWGGSCQPDDA
jgi:hypothetical protein